MSTKEPKAVLHICCDDQKHGQCKEALADFFTKQGFVIADCKPSEKQEMYENVRKVKENHTDIPHLLIGCAEEAERVHNFIEAYPGMVEGAILAGDGQEEVFADDALPVLQIPGVENDCLEVFRRIYRWVEERLDEMLYQAATKF